jgi:hypothetical protein
VAQSQLSPRGRLIVARKSGHYIHIDQPKLVFRAIVKVVALSRHDAARATGCKTRQESGLTTPG